jgi:hypothetical protein
MARQLDRTRTAQVQWASGLNALLGLWLMIAPFTLQYTEFARSAWNAGLVGLAVLLLAGVRAFGAYRRHWAWLSWTNVVLGIWLMAGPFAFGNSDVDAIVGNHVIVGAGIAALGVWSALASPKQRGEAR